eukprot:scaffold808_cov129-Skeletonema_dohrnii-CCMP3373.AAC.9
MSAPSLGPSQPIEQTAWSDINDASGQLSFQQRVRNSFVTKHRLGYESELNQQRLTINAQIVSSWQRATTTLIVPLSSATGHPNKHSHHEEN